MSASAENHELATLPTEGAACPPAARICSSAKLLLVLLALALGGSGRSAAASEGEDALLAAVDAATRVFVDSGGGQEWAPPAPAARCKIYILDPSLELAPALGIPSCNLSEAWPFGQSGQGVEGLHRSPHWAAQHASGYWVAQAIANGPHHTKFMREADLIYVHTHCYHMWYNALMHKAASSGEYSPFNDASTSLSRLFTDGITEMRSFVRTAGRRFVVSRPSSDSPPGAMLDACAKLQRTFSLAGERGVFCDNDRDRAANGNSLILPYVVVAGVNINATARAGPRPTLLYYHGACPVRPRREAPTPGVSLRDAMYAELAAAGPDVRISCGCERCSTAVGQVEIMGDMERATFCPVMAPERQATRSLPAAALSGCLPVFFGPPFHALPLAADIRYPAFSLFFHLTDSARYRPQVVEGVQRPLPPGQLEPDAEVAAAVISVPTFAAAVAYMRAMPAERLEAMKAALDEERLKFYYPPIPPLRLSAPGKIIVRRMCEYAARLKEEVSAQRAQQAEQAQGHGRNYMPQIPKGGFEVLPEEDSAGDGGGVGGVAAAAGETKLPVEHLGGIGEEEDEEDAAANGGAGLEGGEVAIDDEEEGGGISMEGTGSATW